MKRTIKQPRKIRRNKVFFDDRKTARDVASERRQNVYRVKYGRHRGKYFVGYYMEFLNID